MNQPNNNIIPPKKIKTVPSGLEDEVNKFVTNLRVFGFISILISMVAILSYMSTTDGFYNILGIFLFAFLITGTVMFTIGETLWRVLLKHSGTVKPLFSLFKEK